MAILAEGLIMAVNAVVRIPLSRYPMLGIPETQMIRGRSLALMALVAFLDR
jgi:hypothetical protein